MVVTESRYDVKAIANTFLDWSDQIGIEVSPMKLQKLLFFSHADFIVMRGRPLLKQGFEAWDYGPVNPSIYQEFKRFGDRPITARACAFNPLTASTYVPRCEISGADEQLLKERFAFYRRFSAVALSDLSHSRASPWRQARSLFANGLNAERAISNELIGSFHRLFDD